MDQTRGKESVHTEIPIDAIEESPFNPRLHYDAAADRDLERSIQANGVEKEVVVRPLSNNRYQLLDGSRRVRAAKKVGLKTIPAEVRVADDARAMELAFILNDDADVHPLDGAAGYAKLLEKGKMTAAELAAILGKPDSFVVQRLRLNKLIAPGKNACFNGALPVSHALEIARLQPPEQERCLTFALKGWAALQQRQEEYEYHNPVNPNPHDESDTFSINGPDKARTVCSLADLKQFIAQRIHLDLRAAAFDKKDNTLPPIACVNCPKRTGFARELFNDITKEDICTDPACFHAKQAEHVKRLKESLKKSKTRFIEVTDDQIKPDGHQQAKTWRSLKEVKGKPCKHAVTGILIDASNMGHTKLVCYDKACKQHWGGGSSTSPSTPAKKPEKTKTPEQVEKERIAEVRRRIEDKVREEALESLQDAALRRAMDEKKVSLTLLWNNAGWEGHDAAKRLLKVTKASFAKQSPAIQLKAVNVAMMAVRLSDTYEWDDLVEVVQEAGVDVAAVLNPIRKKIEEQHAEELKPKRSTEETKADLIARGVKAAIKLGKPFSEEVAAENTNEQLQGFVEDLEAQVAKMKTSATGGKKSLTRRSTKPASRKSKKAR